MLEVQPEAKSTPEFINNKLNDEYNKCRDNQEMLQGMAKVFQAN